MLYKRAFILYEYEKDFKFLGKGFGENPLYKEGFPRKTLPEKIINALLSFSERVKGKPLFIKRGFPLEIFRKKIIKGS